MEVLDHDGGKVDVRVHQVVKSPGGDVLSDSEVWHFYTIRDGFIEQMDLQESGEDAGQRPSAAFHRPV